MDEPNGENQDRIRALVTQFYIDHNPEKVGTVEAILKRYGGRERELIDDLGKKYNTIIDTNGIVFSVNNAPNIAMSPDTAKKLPIDANISQMADKLVKSVSNNFQSITQTLSNAQADSSLPSSGNDGYWLTRIRNLEKEKLDLNKLYEISQIRNTELESEKSRNITIIRDLQLQDTRSSDSITHLNKQLVDLNFELVQVTNQLNSANAIIQYQKKTLADTISKLCIEEERELDSENSILDFNELQRSCSEYKSKFDDLGLLYKAELVKNESLNQLLSSLQAENSKISRDMVEYQYKSVELSSELAKIKSSYSDMMVAHNSVLTRLQQEQEMRNLHSSILSQTINDMTNAFSDQLNDVLNYVSLEVLESVRLNQVEKVSEAGLLLKRQELQNIELCKEIFRLNQSEASKEMEIRNLQSELQKAASLLSLSRLK